MLNAAHARSVCRKQIAFLPSVGRAGQVARLTSMRMTTSIARASAAFTDAALQAAKDEQVTRIHIHGGFRDICTSSAPVHKSTVRRPAVIRYWVLAALGVGLLVIAAAIASRPDIPLLIWT